MLTKVQRKRVSSEKICLDFLYVGTSEEIAKVAPLRGLPDKSILSIYPGYFASISKSEKWGIIKIDMKQLYVNALAPYHFYKAKTARSKRRENTTEKLQRYYEDAGKYNKEWRKSLEYCGVCLYTQKINVSAIMQISIYKPYGRDSNDFITSACINNNPNHLDVSKYKNSINQQISLTKWLCAESTNGQEWLADRKEEDVRLETEISESMFNKLALDIFYRR